MCHCVCFSVCMCARSFWISCCTRARRPRTGYAPLLCGDVVYLVPHRWMCLLRRDRRRDTSMSCVCVCVCVCACVCVSPSQRSLFPQCLRLRLHPAPPVR
ncbi:MAG: hypothetical protein P4L40_24505 [Terracidiphilus sp.]|nr:hypothetical protein [Terracidiphilus sp.]